jgi:hypothetical protein
MPLNKEKTERNEKLTQFNIIVGNIKQQKKLVYFPISMFNLINDT